MQEVRISREIQNKLMDLTLALYRVTALFPKEEVLSVKLRDKGLEIMASLIEYGFTNTPEKERTLILAKITTIKEYLNIALAMNFTNFINCQVLDREYSLLSDFFIKEISAKKITVENTVKIRENTAIKSEELASWREFTPTPKSHGRESVDEWSSSAKRIDESHERKPMVWGFTTDDKVKILTTDHNSINERQKAIIGHLKQSKEAKISDFFKFFSDISSKTIQRDLQDLVSKNLLVKEGEKRWTTYSLKSDNMSDIVL